MHLYAICSALIVDYVCINSDLFFRYSTFHPIEKEESKWIWYWDFQLQVKDKSSTLVL